MLRLEAGDVAGYALDVTSDLLGIDCRGATDAFAVGREGVALRTFDAGETWERMELDDSTLRAVSAAERDIVYAVGDGGGFWISRDSGDTWTRSEAEVDLTAVDTSADGRIAVAVGADGSVFRYELGRALERVRDGDGRPLWSVAVSPAAELVVVVGARGRALRSDDGGWELEPIDLGTEADLHAVRVAASGDTMLAAGERGTIVRWRSAQEATITEWLPPTRTLRAMHVSADGQGIAVGDGGAALETIDFGRSWEPLSLDTAADLFGVDDVHAGAHY